MECRKHVLVIMLAAIAGLADPVAASSANQMTIYAAVAALTLHLAQADSRPIDLSVKSFETCSEYPGLDNEFTDIGLSLDPDTRMLIVNSTLVIKAPVVDGVTVHIILRKCFTDNPNSCEVYMENKDTDFCEQISQEEKIWTSIIRNIQNFGPECPVQPGNYILGEAPVDLTGLGNFEALIGFWQLELQFMFKGKMLMCIMGDGEVFKRKRGRKNKPPVEDDAPLPSG